MARAGDWVCPHCSASNFAARTLCFKCSESRPAAAVTGGPRGVEVATVDGFQGREAAVVLFSCVRTAGGGRVGFLADLRRQNVALTRAKHSLVVVGDAAALREHEDWGCLVDHCEGAGRFLAAGSLEGPALIEAVERVAPSAPPDRPTRPTTGPGVSPSVASAWGGDRDAYFAALSYPDLSEQLQGLARTRPDSLGVKGGHARDNRGKATPPLEHSNAAPLPVAASRFVKVSAAEQHSLGLARESAAAAIAEARERPMQAPMPVAPGALGPRSTGDKPDVAKAPGAIPKKPKRS